MARYHRRVSGKFVASAMAAGVVLAALHGHAPAAGATAAPGSGAPNEQLANSMAASGYGWTGRQATCLDDLWTEESAGTWSPTVTNLTSGASGIPQALPASKMAADGADYMTNPVTQIRWGLSYISSTYGDPCTAWAHEQADSWY